MQLTKDTRWRERGKAGLQKTSLSNTSVPNNGAHEFPQRTITCFVFSCYP